MVKVLRVSSSSLEWLPAALAKDKQGAAFAAQHFLGACFHASSRPRGLDTNLKRAVASNVVPTAVAVGAEPLSGFTRRWLVVVCALVLGLGVSLFAQPDTVDMRCLEPGIATCLKRAQDGDAAAQYLVGMVYRIGGPGRNSLPQDFAKAVRWFRLAAKQGHALALLDLGRAYVTGEGVRRNDARAYLWLSLAADALVTGVTTSKNLAVEERDQVAARLGDQQRAAMMALATKCRSSGFKDCGEPAR
jgi:TPR repeat protein